MNTVEQIGNIKLACKMGDLETIIKMQHNGCSLTSIRNEIGQRIIYRDTLFIIAAEHGHLAMLGYLSNYISRKRMDLVFDFSARNGHIIIFKYLLECHSNKYCDPIALQVAAKYNYMSFVKQLIEKGVNIHVDEDCALRRAVYMNDFTLVQWLLDRGANIHVTNETPLNLAVINDRLEMVKLLVKNGANVNGESLKCACRYGYLEILKYLVGIGADLYSVKGECIESVLINKQAHIVKYLMKYVSLEN